MPKLPKGMYRRGRVYYLRVQRGGRDTRRSLGSSFEEAVRAYRGLTRRPELLANGRVSVREAIARWVSSAIASRRIASGRRDVQSRMIRYVMPLWGERMLAAITPDDLLALRATLEQDGHKVTLVHRVLSDTRAFLRWAALDARLIADAPIPRRLMPRLQQSFPKRLTDAEVEKVESIPEPYAFVVRLGLSTGLRWGELTRVTAEDVTGGVLHVSQTKSGKVRRVPLADAIVREVVKRRGRLVAFSHPGMFSRQVRRHSGVRRFHTHMMRHTFASRWVEAGGNLAVLQALLGHSSILVTQRYAQLSDAAIMQETRRVSLKSGTQSGTVEDSAAFRNRGTQSEATA